jgi:hypothetical protein
MEANALWIVAVVMVMDIVLLCAFSLVNAFTPEFIMSLVAIIALVAIVRIVAVLIAM